MIINELAGSPTRSDNVYFANNEQVSLVFSIAHAGHNFIKPKLYYNWVESKIKLQHNKKNFLGLNGYISMKFHFSTLVKSAINHNNAEHNLFKFKLFYNWSVQTVNNILESASSNLSKTIKFAHL